MKILKKIMVVFFILALFSLTSVYADENINSCEDVSNPYIADSTEGVGLSYDDASIMAEDSNEEIEDEDKYFELSRTSYPGWHWEVNPESYGVELVSQYDVVNAPSYALVGAPATTYFKFHIISDDYYVDLQLINPWGDIEPPIFINPKPLTPMYINNETPIDAPSAEYNAENNTLEENTTKHKIQTRIEPIHVDVLVNDTPTDSDNNTLVEQNSTQNNILQENTTTQNNSSVMVNNTQATNNNTSNNSSVMENTANPLIALLLSCILIPMGIYRKRK